MDDVAASPDAMRTETVLRYLERARGTRCVTCAAQLCGHAAVMSLAMGFKNAPRCFGCLSAGLGRNRDELRDHLYTYIDHHECYRAGWQWASRQEGFDPQTAPPCLWPAAVYGSLLVSKDNGTMTATRSEAHDAAWDAGDMGCGDLVLDLRMRLQALAPGKVLKITARDPGAPEDLPAWCRMTGHVLVCAAHPEYWIRRKET